MVVDTNWLISSAMLMPLERMRLGISSDSASHTHTPGPTAKNATNTRMQAATAQPYAGGGIGPMRACSMRRGACAPLAGSANGFRCNVRKNAPMTLSGCTVPARSMRSSRSIRLSLRRARTLVKSP
ncbi:hypothetical protein D3C73_1084610 [compost metagenome]